MSQVVPLFAARRLSSPPPSGADGADRVRPRRRFYAFADLVRFFALDGLDARGRPVAVRTQIEYLRRLHDHAGMPAPANPRWWAGRLRHGADAIGQRSTWCALEFDAWADAQRNPSPPGPAATAVPPLPRAAREELRHRALRLAGGREA